MGHDVLRLYGANGEIVAGPEAARAVARKAPAVLGRAAGVASKALPWLGPLGWAIDAYTN